MPEVEARYSKLAALALGLALSLVLLVAVDRAAGWLLPVEASIRYPDAYFVNTAYGVPVPGAGTYRVRSEDPTRGETIYDVRYRIDEHGLRVVPLPPAAPRPRFVVLLGGSFTYGEGLPAEHSLAAQLARRAPQLRPYTLAFHGYGPLELLSRLAFDDLSGFVAEPEGDFVFLFIDAHVARVVGNLQSHGWMRRWQTWVEDDGGRLVHVADRRDAWPFKVWLFDLLRHSRLLRLTGFDLPPGVRPRDLRKTAQAFRQMREQSLRQRPASRFWLVLFPGSRLGMPVAERLGDTDIRILDYRGLFDPRAPAHRLHRLDQHPSARAVGLLAEQLAVDLATDLAADLGAS